jgi:predicted ester cyclase
MSCGLIHERVVASGKYDEILKFIGADYADHNSPLGSPRGPAAVGTHLRGIRHTFPDFDMQIHEIVAEGDWVTSRVTARTWGRGVESSLPAKALRFVESTSIESQTA